MTALGIVLLVVGVLGTSVCFVEAAWRGHLAKSYPLLTATHSAAVGLTVGGALMVIR